MSSFRTLVLEIGYNISTSGEEATGRGMASVAVGFLHPRPSPLTAPHKHFSSPILPKTLLRSSNTLYLSPSSSHFSPVLSERWRPSFAAESQSAPVLDSDMEDEWNRFVEAYGPELEFDPWVYEKPELPKKEWKGIEVYAVVMVGSRQYIVIPGRHIYTQRLKGANVNDKIILNKVLLVRTKSGTYVGKPVVTNAAVHAVVEEQGLDKKVIVFKYKKRKNYRRNIGHRQPNTRLRITGITGYEDYPVATMVAA